MIKANRKKIAILPYNQRFRLLLAMFHYHIKVARYICQSLCFFLFVFLATVKIVLNKEKAKCFQTAGVIHSVTENNL